LAVGGRPIARAVGHHADRPPASGRSAFGTRDRRL